MTGAAASGQGALGGLALVVAAIGLYGVISNGIAQRRREVGLRIALGATRRNIVWLVMRQGLVVAAAGVMLGALLALGASAAMQPLLFAQSARDPRVYGTAAGALLIVASLAALVPALRAARENPTAILRGD